MPSLLRIRRPPPPPRAAADPLAAATARASSLAASDPRSAALAAAAARSAALPPPSPALAAAADTADAALLAATELVCVEAGVGGGGEYRQVVLVGPGLDTRAARLPWPRGVVLYDVAPADAHAVAAAAEAGTAGARSPPGTLHVRVAADAAAPGDDVADALAAAGHRGDRLTAAALSLAHLPRDAVRRTLASVARAAARWSLLSGDVPAGSAADAADLLAEAGVSARVEGVGDGVFAFTGQARSMSDAERDTLAAHADAAEEAEGFEGNVS